MQVIELWYNRQYSPSVQGGVPLILLKAQALLKHGETSTRVPEIYPSTFEHRPVGAARYAAPSGTVRRQFTTNLQYGKV